MILTIHKPVIFNHILCFLPEGTGCALRTHQSSCYTITDRTECLVSTDPRNGFLDQPCVWCPDGPCNTGIAGDDLYQCEPKSFVDNHGITGYEDCYVEGTLSTTILCSIIFRHTKYLKNESNHVCYIIFFSGLHIHVYKGLPTGLWFRWKYI